MTLNFCLHLPSDEITDVHSYMLAVAMVMVVVVYLCVYMVCVHMYMGEGTCGPVPGS